MRRAATIAAAALLGACATTPPLPAPVSYAGFPLLNPDFELAGNPAECAPKWSCTVHADPSSYRFSLEPSPHSGGKQALCVARTGREPWALATQYIVIPESLRGARVRFSIALKTDGLDGNGAGPWVISQGIAGQKFTHDEKLVKGTSAWERVAVELTVHPWTYALEVGMAIWGGGAACMDDARFELLEAAKKPV